MNCLWVLEKQHVKFPARKIMVKENNGKLATLKPMSQDTPAKMNDPIRMCWQQRVYACVSPRYRHCRGLDLNPLGIIIFYCSTLIHNELPQPHSTKNASSGRKSSMVTMHTKPEKTRICLKPKLHPNHVMQWCLTNRRMPKVNDCFYHSKFNI